ncbi:MAG: hypothetical protein KDA65_12460 [Planctomycetaceae bacterium]|nr:hypothetical protein [Planctomycetaceae bacterium]
MMNSMEKWTPPDNPNLEKILHEAYADREAGRYKAALQKHLWIHDNAQHVDEAFVGVRLSTALGFWYLLSKAYPPAHQALITLRDEAESRLFEARFRQADFDELTALNKALHAERSTTDVYLRIMEQDRNAAERLFEVAAPALLEAEIYDACKILLNPEQYMYNSLMIYEFQLEDDDLKEEALQDCLAQLNGLFSTLVHYGKKEQALRLLSRVEAEHPQHDWNRLLAPTLRGEIPPPRG